MSYAGVVEVVDSEVEEESGEECGDVGGVGGEEDDTEAAPDIDEHLVGPRLGRLEGDQVRKKQRPHHP